jgi:hypothetical protein
LKRLYRKSSTCGNNRVERHYTLSPAFFISKKPTLLWRKFKHALSVHAPPLASFDQANATREIKQDQRAMKNQKGLSIFGRATLLFYHDARSFSRAFRARF